MRRRLQVALCAGAGLLGLFAYRIIVTGGAFVSVPHKAPGPCRALDGVPGPEDFALDRERGVLYVSSHDRRRPRTPGAIYSVDLHRPFSALAVTRIAADYPPGFYPHGLSLLVMPGGERLLYVVTHPGLEHARSALDFGTEHRIDIFRAEGGGALRQKTSLRDPALQNPNDLHVRAEDDLYVTRDHGATTPTGKMVEDLVGPARASVLHFDGRAFRTAAVGIAYANGVTGTADRLYVAACVGHSIEEYAILEKGQLRLLQSLPIASGPDNLEFDERGDLWIGAHAAPLRFLFHARSAAHLAPSQAVRLSLATGKSEVVYADPGGEIGGSSVAVKTGGFLLIGAVFGDHVLACEAD